MKKIIITALSVILLIGSILLALFFIAPTMELFNNHDIYKGSLELSQNTSYILDCDFSGVDSISVENEELIEIYDELPADAIHLNSRGSKGEEIAFKTLGCGRTVLRATKKVFMLGDRTYLYDVIIASGLDGISRVEATASIDGNTTSADVIGINILGEPNRKTDKPKTTLSLELGNKFSCNFLTKGMEDYIFEAYLKNGELTDNLRIDEEGLLVATAPISGYCNLYNRTKGGIRFNYEVKDSKNLYKNVKISYELSNNEENFKGILDFADIASLEDGVITLGDDTLKKMQNILPEMSGIILINPDYKSIKYKPAADIKRVTLRLYGEELEKSKKSFNASFCESKNIPTPSLGMTIEVEKSLDVIMYPGVYVKPCTNNDYFITSKKDSNVNLIFKSYLENEYNILPSMIVGEVSDNKISQSPFKLDSSRLTIIAESNFIIMGANGMEGPAPIGRADGNKGRDGASAIDCNNLEIRLKNSACGYIIGGNGGAGSSGSSGSYFAGGSGMNGGVGGNGAYALKVNNLTVRSFGKNNGSLYILPGLGGAGGNGSNGHHGGLNNFNLDGGNGGNGGSSGNPGLPLYAKNIKLQANIYLGEAFSLREGYGGKGGEPADGWFGAPKPGNHGSGYNGESLSYREVNLEEYNNLPLKPKKLRYSYDDGFSLSYNIFRESKLF